MLNNIVGARTRTFFRVTNIWQGSFFSDSLLSWAFFGLNHASEGSSTCAKKIAVDISFLHIKIAQNEPVVEEVSRFP